MKPPQSGGCSVDPPASCGWLESGVPHNVDKLDTLARLASEARAGQVVESRKSLPGAAVTAFGFKFKIASGPLNYLSYSPLYILMNSLL